MCPVFLISTGKTYCYLFSFITFIIQLKTLSFFSSAGISIGSLNESHIEIVIKTWKFGRKDAWGMIKNMVFNFPSCCILDAEGRPVSWVLTYACGSMGMLYTVPEHRGKGYAKMVISALARRFFTEGYPVYCFIEEDNTVSCQLFKGLGFTEDDPTYRECWFDFTPSAT
ncbi:hypothetical protein NL108_002330 [Boleophthalmus pectinirostris]|nr:hypothetical protein NL108_002330 [Boleophthalmus pectinirostris]